MILRLNDNTQIKKRKISTWRADIINQSKKGKMKNTTFFLNSDIADNSDVSKFPLSNSSSTPPPSTKGSRYSPWQKRKKAPLLHHRVMQKRNYQHKLRRSIITYSLWSFKFNIGIFLWGEKEFFRSTFSLSSWRNRVIYSAIFILLHFIISTLR